MFCSRNEQNLLPAHSAGCLEEQRSFLGKGVKKEFLEEVVSELLLEA